MKDSRSPWIVWMSTKTNVSLWKEVETQTKEQTQGRRSCEDEKIRVTLLQDKERLEPPEARREKIFS